MRLADLNPSFVGAGGPGIYNADGSPSTRRHGVGVLFDCPCGCDKRCYVSFENPLDGGQRFQEEPHSIWHRVGETFETLTLTPSILRRSPCGWHGYVTDGGIVTV